MSDVFYIQQFEVYLQSEKKLSAHTVKAYISDLNQCISYCRDSYEIDTVSELSHSMVKSWLSGFMSEGMDARSVRRKISSLNTFFKYLLKHQLVQKNIMLKVSSPKMAKKLPVFIEENKMNDIIESRAEKNNEEKHGIANDILLTLYHTGIRLSELLHLEKKHVDVRESTIKVLGKRNKERIIPMTDELNSALRKYLNQFPESPYIFNTEKGKPLYPNYVYRLIKNVLSAQSTVKKKSPHVLRHTFATHLLNNGGDLNAIKELLGHANLSATQVYTHNSVERLKKIHQQAHPKGDKRNH